MADKPFEFVDETEEPYLRGTVTRGGLTGWETVVFLVAEPDDQASISEDVTGDETP